MIDKILDKFFKNDDVFFIGSSDILPPPLKKNIEEDLVRKSNLGDLDARNKLIEHNLRLVVFLAKKYDNTMYDLEDLVSIGTIGLIKGIKTYKLDKNIKLATYASRCIDNEILMFLRKNKKRNSEVSLEDSINFDSEGNELKLEDVFGTEDNVVEKSIESKDDKILLEKEVKNLASRDRNIIEQRYGLFGQKELTQKELADKLNISQSYISRIEKRVIKKLKLLMKI
ncbi:rNA polymerase sigma factor [Clostridium sp. CAG:1000]|jgi:RNA polymerase sporulation-specific sigma factor|nr:sigma-70 family RNA polymerase sigma factor [Clostridium sp.]CCX35491.1 rNA polymerase sigma factor [Clostridium sp. CAG:1000]